MDPRPTLVVYHILKSLSRKNLCGVTRTFAGLAADLVEFEHPLALLRGFGGHPERFRVPPPGIVAVNFLCKA